MPRKPAKPARAPKQLVVEVKLSDLQGALEDIKTAIDTLGRGLERKADKQGIVRIPRRARIGPGPWAPGECGRPDPWVPGECANVEWKPVDLVGHLEELAGLLRFISRALPVP